MNKIKLIFSVVAVASLFVFIIPSAHAAPLTPQEEQYLASLSVKLHELARLLDALKRALLVAPAYAQTPPAAPFGVYIRWQTSQQPLVGTYQLAIDFQHAETLSSGQAFRLYLKKPGELSFSAVATFTNPYSLDYILCAKAYSGAWSLLRCSPSYWTMYGPLEQSSAYQAGEYSAYISIVDSSALDSSASSVVKNILSKSTVLSPVGAQSSLSPQFRWTVASGWQGGYFHPRVFKDGTYVWSKDIYLGVGITEGSVAYDGAALAPSTTYYAEIIGADSAGGFNYFAMGESAPSFTVSASDTTAPSTPTGLSATAVSSWQINLSWSASTDADGVIGYRIYRNGTQIATASSTSYSDTGLSAGTIYGYTVAAYDAAGNVSSQSSSANATTSSVASPISIRTGTGIVADSQIFSFGIGTVYYSVALNGVSGYIYSGSNTAPPLYFANPTSSDVCTLYPPAHGYQGVANISQFTSAANYTFSNAESSVRVYDKSSSCYQGILLFRQNNLYGGIDPEDIDGSGNLHYRYWYDESGGSNFGAVSAVSDSIAPSVPAGLSATAVSSSQINLSWSASTDAVGVTGYRVYRGGTQIATASSTTYSNTGLTAATTYSYTVAAYDAAGNVSPQSAIVSAATLSAMSTTTATTTTTTTITDTTPPVISNIQASIGPVVSGSYPRATITWTTNEAADTEMEYYYGSPTGIPYVHLYTFATSHSAATAELVTGATYYYRVSSTDAAGNKTTSNWYALTVTTTTTTATTTVTTTTTTAATPTYQTTTTGETLVTATTTMATVSIIPFAVDSGRTFPQPGSAGADVASRISVTFTKDIDSASLKTNFFMLASAASPATPISGSLSVAPNGFVFTPSAGLQQNTAYIYTVFPVVKDTSGTLLPSAFSATFTTGSVAASLVKTGEVAGKVTDSGGIPLAGATVYFFLSDGSSRNITTDATGAYDMFLPEGSYRAELFPPSGRTDLIRPAPASLAVSGGQKQTLHLQFPAGTKVITGLILFSNAQVVGDAEVGAYSSDSGQEARGTVDAKGRYTLRVGGGKWQVGIRPKDSANAKWSYPGPFPAVYFSRDTIAETQIADFLVPVFDATIRVRAVDESGKAITGVGVALDTVSSAAAVVQETRTPPQFLKSDTTGLATFTVRGGIYYIRGTAAPELGLINPDEQALTIYTGEAKDVKLIFRKPSSVALLTLSGITKLENGTPTDAFVWAWSEKGGFAKTRADAAGIFTLPLGPNDRWHLGAGKEEGGIAYKASDVVLVVGSSTPAIEIILGRAKEIVLQAVSASKPATETIVVQAPDGAKMTLPSSAAAGSGTVSVEVKQTVEAPSQAAAQIVSAVYDVTVRDTAGTTITKLNDVAEIVLPYKEEDLKAQGVSEDVIVPSFFDETVGVWVKIDNYTVDKDKNIVVARVKHLTRFAIVAAADITPPAAPTSVSASALGGGNIKISWVNPGRDFSHVKVYKSERAGALGEILAAEVPGIQTTDAAVRNGVTYYYTVRAVDPAGNESGNTNQTAIRAVGTSPALAAQSAKTLPLGQTIVSPSGALSRNLSRGSSGEDVKTLQSFLLKEGVYPEGLITGYFGTLTRQAVIRFQEKYRDEILAPLGIMSGTGFVGKATRVKLQKLIGE